MTHIPKAFCVDCQCEMKPHLNGLVILTQTQDGRDYYKISTDSYACPGEGCENMVALTSPSTKPVMNFEEGFEEISEEMTVRFR